MKRAAQLKHNQNVIKHVKRLLIHKSPNPSYKIVCRYLKKANLTSSIGNEWTERSLYRMLQRSGYSGLWGLNRLTE